MEASVENTSKLGRRVKVSVSDATVKAQVKEKMSKLAKEAHLKGFRPGKVPLPVLQQKFGAKIRMEVINELIQSSYTDLIKENALQPAGQPKIEEIKNKQNENLEFVATFEVFPEIQLNDFSEIEIEKRVSEIKDDDVQKMIAKLQDQLAGWEQVDRTVQSNDRLNVDFARKLKEEAAKREEQKNVQMIVGVEGVLPGLSEALIGKSKEETIEVESRYPSNWADGSVADKDVTLWVTINEIAEKHPLSKEALAKKLNIENEDLEKLQQTVRERMQAELDQTLQEELKEIVLEKFLEKNPIELPESLVDQEKEAIRREHSRAKRKSAALPAHEIEEQARQRVELGLLLNEVIKKHSLKVQGQRVREEIEKIAVRFPKPQEVVQAYYNNNELLYGVERMVLLEQAVDAILKEVKVTEVKASFDEIMNPVDKKDSD